MLQLYPWRYKLDAKISITYKSPSFLASTLKAERKRVNLTQHALAKATGLGLKTIRKIEQDDHSVTMSNINQVLNFFGLELGPKKLMTSPTRKTKNFFNKEEILKVLKGISPIFKSKFNITTLGLFGSFARDEGESSSDIDIIFEGETTLSNEGEMTLILEHLFCGYIIDFTNSAHLDPRLKESILEDVIYV